MAVKKAPAATPKSDRPWAESPAPENVRVDPGSADTEYLKALLPPDAPLPVFSTMGLIHGKEASGAKWLRPGFAWNPQMDLLWALGYPQALLIVDGFPADSSKEAHAAYWDPAGNATGDKDPWWGQWWDTQPRFISRAGAYAALFELQQFPKRLMAQSDAEFLEASQPIELTPAKIETLIWGTSNDLTLAHTARLLEALAGPDAVAEALCAAAESTTLGIKIREGALPALGPVLRRIRDGARADVIKRLDKVSVDNDSVFARRRFRVTRPLEYTQAKLAENSDPTYWELDWIEGAEDLVLTGHKKLLERKIDIPQTRFAFTGGPKIFATEVANFKKYDPQDAASAYVKDYTTLADPIFLTAALQVGTRKEERPKMQAWFQGHAAALRPTLEDLAKGDDPKIAKLAGSVLKSL